MRFADVVVIRFDVDSDGVRVVIVFGLCICGIGR